MLQTNQLLALRAVLDAGSFAAAAEQLGLTPSAVSQQISALERALGLPLFERTARATRPTAAADYLGGRVDGVLGQLELLEVEAHAVASGIRGAVRIGSFPTASARLLPRTFAALAGRRAGIDVLLDEAEPDELLRRLQQGTLDLALVYSYDALPVAWVGGLDRQPLLTESLLLLGPNQGPRLRPDLSNAAEHAWVSSREDTAGARCLQTLCGVAGFSPRVKYRSNDYDVVRGLVAAGLGVAVVPALAYQQESGTRSLPLTLPNASRTVYLTFRAADGNPLLDTVRRAFKKVSATLVSPIIKRAS